MVSKASTTTEALSVQKCVGADGKVLPAIDAQLNAWFNAEQPKWAAEQPKATVGPIAFAQRFLR